MGIDDPQVKPSTQKDGLISRSPISRNSLQESLKTYAKWREVKSWTFQVIFFSIILYFLCSSFNHIFYLAGFYLKDEFILTIDENDNWHGLLAVEAAFVGLTCLFMTVLFVLLGFIKKIMEDPIFDNYGEPEAADFPPPSKDEEIAPSLFFIGKLLPYAKSIIPSGLLSFFEKK